MGVFLAGCGDGEEVAQEEKIKMVETLQIVTGVPAGMTVRKSAALEPKSEVEVVSEGNGKVVEVLFEEGDFVEKGQVLVKMGEAISNTQDRINQVQAAASLSSARQTLSATQVQATEIVVQGRIALENAILSLENALKNQSGTEESLLESEGAKRIAVDKAELALKNAVNGAGQSVDIIYETSVPAINSALSNAGKGMRDANELLAVEKENPNINQQYRTYLGATNPQALTDAEMDYMLAKNLTVGLMNLSASRGEIDAAFPRVENYLQAVIEMLNSTDLTLQNTVANANFTQNEIDTFRSSLSTDHTSVSASLGTVQGKRQGLSSTGISNTTALDAARKSLESAEQQLAATLTSNEVQRENLRHAVSAAQKNVAAAESAFKASQENSKSSVISAQSSVNAAAQQWNLTSLATRNVVVKAPISGRVLKRDVDPGVLVNMGSPVATIGVLSELKMNIDFTFTESKYLAEGGVIRVWVADDADPIFAEITRVAPVADPVTRKIAVEITILDPDETLKSNLLAEAEIPFNAEFFEERVLVPLKSVRIGQDKKSVLQVLAGEVIETEVETGGVFGEWVEVVDLEEGQEIIREPGGLQIGEKVTDKEVKFKQSANLE